MFLSAFPTFRFNVFTKIITEPFIYGLMYIRLRLTVLTDVTKIPIAISTKSGKQLYNSMSKATVRSWRSAIPAPVLTRKSFPPNKQP